MLLLANALEGLAAVLNSVLFIYQWILIARAVISWVNPDPRNPIVAFLYAVTEPVLRPVRRWLPASLRYFPLDVAFLVVLGLVIFAEYGVVKSLVEYAEVLRSDARRTIIRS